MKLSLIAQLYDSGSIDLLDTLRLRGQKRVDARHLVDELRKELQVFNDERQRVITGYFPDGKMDTKNPEYKKAVADIVELLDSYIDTEDPFLFTEVEAMEFEPHCKWCIGGAVSCGKGLTRLTNICEITKIQVKWARIYWDEYNKTKE